MLLLTLATITIEQRYYHWWGGEYSNPTYLLVAKMKRLMRNMEDSTNEEEDVLSDSPSINESVETPIPTSVLLVLSLQIHTLLTKPNEIQDLAEKPSMYNYYIHLRFLYGGRETNRISNREGLYYCQCLMQCGVAKLPRPRKEIETIEPQMITLLF